LTQEYVRQASGFGEDPPRKWTPSFSKVGVERGF
jgi:hypothetical protein